MVLIQTYKAIYIIKRKQMAYGGREISGREGLKLLPIIPCGPRTVLPDKLQEVQLNSKLK